MVLIPTKEVEPVMNREGRSLATLCIFLSLVFVLGTATGVAGTEIRVDPGEVVSEVHPEVFGHALIYRGPSMGYRAGTTQRKYDEAKQKWNYYLPYLDELGPTIIRYPDGLGANNFDWKAGIGPVEEREPDYDGKGVPQVFGTDEFLQYCEDLGAEAILVVNVSVAGKRPGNVQDAADWVEYCNAPNDGSNPGGGIDWAARRAANGHKEPYNVRYWELGNEDLYPSWEDYAARVRAYSAAMKAIDPTIKIGAICTGGGIDSVFQQKQWIEYHGLMLEKAGDAFDFWIHHTHAPGSDGIVDGFKMIRDGTSVSVDFTAENAGTYKIQLPVEGGCRWGHCPRLRLWIDGELRGDWTLRAILQIVDSQDFFLSKGPHHLKIEVEDLGDGGEITVCQQVPFMQGGTEPAFWVDLKDSLEVYHSFLGGWALAEDVLVLGLEIAGGKPVFYTEADSEYKNSKSPPYISKASALREMLSVGCLYQAFLRHGIEEANYWILFQEQDGVGVLEGVAYDGQAEELGRLDPRRRPVFYLLQALRWNAFDRVVATEVTGSPTFLTGRQTGVTIGYAQRDFELPYLQVLATASDEGDKLSLFVINLDSEEDLPARVDLGGFRPGGPAKVLTITGPSLGASNEPEECPAGDCVTTTEQALSVQGSSFSYRFPRHSVTVFVFVAPGVDQAPPRAPTGLSGSAGPGRIQLLWDANGEGDLAGYHVYRSRTSNGPFRYRVNKAVVKSTDFLDTTVDDGVTYTYAVKAVDVHGNESPFSNKIVLTAGGSGEPVTGDEDKTPPSPPILLEAR